MTLELYRYARPVLNCDVLPAVSGWALVHGLSIYPVFDQARPILDDLNGKKTLLEIESAHGLAGLNFTGELLRRGYVTLDREI